MDRKRKILVRLQEGRGRCLKWAGVLTGFLLCAAAVLYPFLSNSLYEKQQSKIIVEYQKRVDILDKKEQAGELARCRRYNAQIKRSQMSSVSLKEARESDCVEGEGYDTLLNMNQDGIMGYLEIPEIEVYLPVYHSASASVLENGLGHVPETSLPIGGEGTHAVITGHSGMPDKRLFSDLPELETGDWFVFHVLGEDLYYEVDRVEVVLPNETESLLVEEEEDRMTLVTCTPFGVNSHRLLVSGIRIRSLSATKTDAGLADLDGSQSGKKWGEEKGVWIKEYERALLFGLFCMAVSQIFSFIVRKKREHREKQVEKIKHW